MFRYNFSPSTTDGNSSIAKTVLMTAVFLVVGGLIVFAATQLAAGLDPSSTKTVTKTIVVEYNLGNYSSADGTQSPMGDGSAYEKSYSLTIPAEAQGSIATTLQLSSEAGGACEGNFSAFICSQEAESMTVLVTRVDSTAAWNDNLVLKAVNFFDN